MTGFLKLTKAHDADLTLAWSHRRESNISN